MGMFDYVHCEYPLPVEGVNALEFQTKDTPEQYMEHYRIESDGTLSHEDYDIEDRSDPKAEGWKRLLGCQTRVNKRWDKIAFTGEICFYTTLGKHNSGWIEFSSYFENGCLKLLNLIEHRPATPESESEREAFLTRAFRSLEASDPKGADSVSDGGKGHSAPGKQNSDSPFLSVPEEEER